MNSLEQFLELKASLIQEPFSVDVIYNIFAMLLHVFPQVIEYFE